MLRVLMIALLLSLPVVQAGERLTWMMLPIPGGVNVVDGDIRGGMAVELLAALQPGLAARGVEVGYELTNLPRLHQQLEEGRSLCAAVLLPTEERDRLGYFVPLIQLPPLQVVVRQSDLLQLPLREGRVLWQGLLQGRMQGAVQNGRVYPVAIREQLQEAVANGRILQLPVGGSLDNHLRMLSHGRFDFTFEFPLVVAEVERNTLLKESLALAPLDGFEKPEEVGIYCSRNAWGRGMGVHIDAALRDLLSQQSLLPLYRRWLPANSYQTYVSSIEAYLKQRSQQPVVFK